MFFNFGGGMPGGHGHGHGGRGGGRGAASRGEVDNNKFYELLGVSKEADASEIKKAYRKAALQHHPDRGGDAERFKEISKAHEILSDPEKRALYDEGGEEALEGGGGGGGPAGMDIFDLFGGGFGGGARRGKKRSEDVIFPLKVTLEDLYNGTSKKLRLTKNVICAGCKGKGGKGGAEATCGNCRGQGVRMAVRQIGPGMLTQQMVKCSACNGSGSQIAEKDKCTTCAGERVVKEKKTLEVFITKGMRHNERVTFRGEGDEGPDTTPGDVVVVLQQAEHAVFRREAANLFVNRSVTLLEALTGFSFTLTHLDGRVLRIKSPDGQVVKPGDVLAIREEGMPLEKSPYQRGDLFVKVDVVYPTPAQLDEKAIRALTAVLPRPAHTEPAPPADAHEVHLTSVDLAEERRRSAQMEAEYERENYESDDEEEHRGRGQAGCQQQ